MQKNIVVLMLAVLVGLSAFGQVRIAVVKPKSVGETNKASDFELEMIKGKLEVAIGDAGYTIVSRGEVDALLKDFDFESNSVMRETDKAKLATLSDVDYICVSRVAKDGDNYYILSKLINKSNGEVSSPTDVYVQGGLGKLNESCKDLAERMTSKMSGRKISGVSSSPSPSQSYTETAWNINMKMVWVEGGDFLMGCTSEQGSSCNTDEQNVRRVTVDGYYIAMVEVTQSQWEKVMGTTIYQQKSKTGGSNVYGTGPDYPMYYVSWEEAMDFCRQLSQKTGRKYTLPTEAQWEYAARGGKNPDGTKYAGRSSVDAVAWYDGNSGSSTHPVATKQPNALGLYDMSGNVWEWCRDWYSAGYAGYDTNNPQGPESGSYRVYRGGSWNGDASGCRVSFRTDCTPSYRDNFLGFRVVCLP